MRIRYSHRIESAETSSDFVRLETRRRLEGEGLSKTEVLNSAGLSLMILRMQGFLPLTRKSVFPTQPTAGGTN